MADYFTHFSFTVSLANKAEHDYALDRFHQLSAAQQGDEFPADFPAALKEVAEDDGFELDTGSEHHELWFHSDAGGIDAVCVFVQHLLQKFNPTGCVTFEWSHDCSKPRTDAYGGGAAVITAKEIKTLSTAEWWREQTELRPAA